MRGRIALYIRARRGARELSSQTAYRARRTLEDFADFIGPGRAPSRVTRADIERWLASQHVSPSTLRVRFSRLRTFFAYAVDAGWVKKNPCAGIRGPRQPRSLPRSLSRPATRSLMEVLPDARARLIVSLMQYEWLRIAEVARLQIGDVDMRERLLRVVGKGNKTREVALSQATTDAIEKYLVEWPASSGWLVRSFQSPRIGLSAPYVGQLVAGWMKDAGIKERPFDGRSAHALRHHAADEMMEASGDVRLVAEFLGHASLSTTTIYLRRRQVLGPMRAAMDARQ